MSLQGLISYLAILKPWLQGKGPLIFSVCITDLLIALLIMKKLVLFIHQGLRAVKYSTAIVLFLLLQSCEKRPGDINQYASFNITERRKAETISLDTAVFRYPFRVSVKKDKAWIMDLHNPDNYYHAFSYPGFRYLGSFGHKGQAAGEMLSAETFRYQQADFVWTLDANKAQLVRWSSDDGWMNARQKETINLEQGIIRALDFIIYNDSTFIIPDYSGKNRLCWVNRQGKIVKRSGRIPSEKQYSEGARIPLAQAWRSFMDYNPRNGILALATQLGEVLEVYDLRNDTTIVVKGPLGDPEFSGTEGFAIPTGSMGFSDVRVTDRHIYAVFHGRSFKEIARMGNKSRVDGGQYIYVYNLKGEPICKYVLDRFIYGIYVDEDKGIITAVDVNSDQPVCRISL